MVKIIDLEEEFLSEEEAEKTDEDTNGEKDDGIETNIGEKPPDPPEPPDPTQSPDASSSLDTSTSIELAAAQSSASGDIQRRIYNPAEILPSFRVVSATLLWKMIAQYNHQVKLSNGDQQLECSITALSLNTSQTSGLQSETGSEDRRNTQLASYVSRITDDATENKGQMDSDDSTKENSDGVCEKELLAVKAAEIKTELLSSPDLSDYDVSDVSDSHGPLRLQAAINEESGRSKIVEYTTTSFTECAQSTVKKSSGIIDIKVELIDSTDGKEVKKEPEEDEAACLPAHSIVKDCWEQWTDDDRLFNLTDDIHAPSTSASAEVSKTSQASRPNERNRSKLENRHHSLRKRDRTARPLEQRFIFVPTEKIGRILGKGGRRVREIERKTGARIKVEPRRSNKPVTQISLTGTDEQICKADEEICVIIRNFKPAKSGEPVTASVSSQEEMELKRLLIGIKNQVLDAEKKCRIP